MNGEVPRSVKTKVVQLEFNELCPHLMDQFIAAGHLPNFARLRRESLVFVTDAEEQPPYLEPWIQWVTAHTGVAYSSHKVFDLGDGHKSEIPRVWDIAGENGRYPVWVCGSMNSAFRTPISGYVLPDPWSVGTQPHPDGEFEDYLRFVRANVQEHTRDKVPVTHADRLRFLKYMAGHGMSLSTVQRIVSQLAAESEGRNRWKRAALLDRLQWDVFRWYWRRVQPRFATFFLNSTAHLQHVYWRNMAPEEFASKPNAEEQAEYSDAVLYGYRRMDELAGECLDLIDDETAVVFASALSQQPCLKYEDSGGKIFHRPEDPHELLRFAGIEGRPEYAPVMSEQFHLYCSSAGAASDASRKLASLRLEGTPIMTVRHEGNEVFAGCVVFTRPARGSRVVNAAGESRVFHELFYDCSVVKSGMHNPDGILWIRTPERRHGVYEGKVPLRALAPTSLALLGIERPEYMELEPLEPLKMTERAW